MLHLTLYQFPESLFIGTLSNRELLGSTFLENVEAIWALKP